MLNRATLFDVLRTKLFGGFVHQGQVDGIDKILDEWERRGLTDLRWLAYAMATTYHESAQTMQAIREIGQGRGHTYGLPAGPNGQVYYGRGLVQLTWLAGYQKAQEKLSALGYTCDLVRRPDDALVPEIAAAILIVGMAEGWFTGKKLGDYFNPSISDPIGARRIINGTDKASLIAGYYNTIYAALLTASSPVRTLPGSVMADAGLSTPPVIPRPIAPPHLPVPPAPKQTWGEWFKSAFFARK